MGDVARIGTGYARMLEALQARDAAEAAEAGITVEELHARRQAARDAEAEERAREERCHALRDRQSRAARLPLTDADARRIAVGELDDTEPLVAVRAWLASDVPILVMAGSVGRGKTVAAAWACVEHRGLYFRARSFERLFAHRYGDDKLGEQERVLSSGLVVVDDIGGREDTADGLGSYLLDLVDERRGSRTRTLLITNLPRKLFAERYPDPRLHSRLGQSATWMVTRGDDLRGAR